MTESLLIDAAAVERVATSCRAAGEMAFDLEFVSEGRMRAELALVQVAWREGKDVIVCAIDATVVDPTPVLALAGGELPVIAHAGRQDLQLLAARFGLRVKRLFDTQVAAAFVGMGDQVGYGRLVEAMFGARIAKDVQYTDWLDRPLSQRQLDYALDDVRYLPGAADRLRADLDDAGRADWVVAECETLCEISWAAAQAGPEVAWRDVAGARKLRGLERAAVERLAAWRWRTALARNKPTSWVLADRVLLELAARRPRDVAELAKVRGAGEIARVHGTEVLAELAAAVDVHLEVSASPPSSGARVQLWEEVFVALVAGAAERTRIPARWIATRGDCEELARLLDRDDPRTDAHPLLATWRREVIGDVLVGWVRGELALTGDRGAAGVKVIRTSRSST